MNDRQRLEAIVSVVCKYLPPDGTPIKEAMSEIISYVDPLPPLPAQEPVAWMTINEYGEEDDIHYENPEGHLLEGWTYKPLYTRPPSVQPVKLRRGDILRCIETDELCTVWSTSTTGKTLVKWSANNFGDYTAEQIGELFWLELKPEQELVAWMHEWADGERIPLMYASDFRDNDKPVSVRPLVFGDTTPQQRPWVGLSATDIHDTQGYEETREMYRFARDIEAKLKEKNT